LVQFGYLLDKLTVKDHTILLGQDNPLQLPLEDSVHLLLDQIDDRDEPERFKHVTLDLIIDNVNQHGVQGDVHLLKIVLYRVHQHVLQMVRLPQLESRTAGLLHHVYKYTYAPRIQLYLLVLQHYQVFENSPTVTL
jgi:hypothetical protein